MQSNAIEFFNKLNAFSISYSKNISTMFDEIFVFKKNSFLFLKKKLSNKRVFLLLIQIKF